MQPLPIVRDAVRTLCDQFESNGYGLSPIIDLGALVANADGVVDDEELQVLRYLLEALLGTHLKPQMVQWLVRSSLRVILEAGLEPRARLIAEILLDCDAVDAGIVVALAVAFSSDGLSEPERRVVELIARHAGVPRKNLSELITRVQVQWESQTKTHAATNGGS